GEPASARATTSGPIPRGSPSVTARRVREEGEAEAAATSETNVYVGEAAQLIHVMLDHQIGAEDVADLVLHVLERQVALGLALGHLDHRELRLAPAAEHDHGLQPGSRIARH